MEKQIIAEQEKNAIIERLKNSLCHKSIIVSHSEEDRILIDQLQEKLSLMHKEHEHLHAVCEDRLADLQNAQNQIVIYCQKIKELQSQVNQRDNQKKEYVEALGSARFSEKEAMDKIHELERLVVRLESEINLAEAEKYNLKQNQTQLVKD